MGQYPQVVQCFVVELLFVVFDGSLVGCRVVPLLCRTVVRLFGCRVVPLVGCTVVPLAGCTVVRLVGCGVRL